MADALVIVLLVAAAVSGLLLARRRARRGSACCGERDEAPRRLRVTDRDKSHYPHVITCAVGGMTCENCAIRVENALNSLPGTWASVSIASREATIRSKDEPDLDALRQAVSTAGYALLSPQVTP